MAIVVMVALFAAAVAATVVCGLKRRAWFLAYGVAVSALSGAGVVSAIWFVGDDLEGLYTALYLLFLGPLVSLVIAGASGSARPGSWWAHRHPGPSPAPDGGGDDERG
jgi:hypothetical protein